MNWVSKLEDTAIGDLQTGDTKDQRAAIKR